MKEEDKEKEEEKKEIANFALEFYNRFINYLNSAKHIPEDYKRRILSETTIESFYDQAKSYLNHTKETLDLFNAIKNDEIELLRYKKKMPFKTPTINLIKQGNINIPIHPDFNIKENYYDTPIPDVFKKKKEWKIFVNNLVNEEEDNKLND